MKCHSVVQLLLSWINKTGPGKEPVVLDPTQEQEQERSPGYISPTPIQFIYTTRS